MTFNSILVMLFLFLMSYVSALIENTDNEEKFFLLKPGIEKRLISPDGKNRLEVFCYAGESHSFSMLLKTVELVVKVPKDNFYYYEGLNFSSVFKQYKERSWFSFSPWKRNSFRLSLYNMSCIGVETSESFKVNLKVRHIDFWRVITLSLGVGLFFLSPMLAQNIFFHYMAGVSVGIFGSLLVIVFVLSKLVPKKTGAFTILFGGWGLVIYVLQYMWNNCVYILKEYQTVIVGYITLAGFISFALVYRYGPINNIRSLKLVQWGLQIASLALVFVSSQCREFSLSVVLFLIFQYNIPLSWRMKARSFWYMRFPPKMKLLTEDEYFDQSRKETKKALEDLRNFCHSPECNAWKTMSRLKSPQRFAEFVDGSFHLSDDEILAYENINGPYLTEDELMTSDEDDNDAVDTIDSTDDEHRRDGKINDDLSFYTRSMSYRRNN